MNRSHHHALTWGICSLAAGLIVPRAIRLGLDLFVAHRPPANAVRQILNEYATDSPPIFSIGMMPFILLAACCAALCRQPPRRLAFLATGGLLGILGLTVYLYTGFWFPHYSPGAIPDANAPIALLFFPFYCVFGMAAGMSLGWLAARTFLKPPKLPATDPSAGR